MKMMLGKSFGQKLKQRIERYEFEAGILSDKTRYEAQDTTRFGEPPLKEYAGGPSRKVTRVKSEKTNAEVFKDNMERLNIDLLRKPLEDKNSDIMKFTRAFLNMATGGKTGIKRVENLLQAVIRNPILRGDYGPNSSMAADNKGFDRHLIDTAQVFKEIKVKAKVRGQNV